MNTFPYSGHMERSNVDFKLLSLNARGIRTFEKRKAIFSWLGKSGADICFLQETYSTREVENIWRKQWKGDMFFAHGSCHSRGVSVLVKFDLDFKLQSVKADSQGRFILLVATIQDSPYVLLNIYAPNKSNEQCDFFENMSEEVRSVLSSELNYSIVIGGDFNVIVNQELDGQGGNKRRKFSAKTVEDLCVEHDLVDIWRIRNPTAKRFTWRQKNPVIQRRLDYWLTSDSLQVDVDSVDIVSSIKSDHSAITLSINGLDDNERGPNFWKFNSTLVNDSKYCNLLKVECGIWLDEFKEVQDKRVLWDLIKYKIRQLTIAYSKTKARNKRAKLNKLEESLKVFTKKCDTNPSKENFEELECLQAEYDQMYDYITQGSIIRSRATWYEMGEKNNKYFLNLEKHNKKKSSVRKIFTSEGKMTTDPKKIMNELESFYSNLYDGSRGADSETITSFLNDSLKIPKLTEDLRSDCEGKLGYSECYNVLQSFQNNKSPGNEGLTAEFYLAFWPLIGRLLVDSINYAFHHGELSNSQKQAIITLIEKKGKDKRLIKNWRPISLINVDVKIASKTLAKRVEKVLPSIIHYNQNAFVKGRTIFDAIRTIDDIIDYTKHKGLSGFLVAIDFEKAFDTVNFKYLLRTLHSFNFGPSFIQWIRVLYENASSCVMNNGFTTGHFALGRGVRQGDPLSPYLYIIALEVLAIKIRNDDHIQGITVGQESTKLSLFADDMTCFLKDELSYTNLFRTLKAFGECSGLKVNHEKTEILVLGSDHASIRERTHREDFSDMPNLSEVIKILGVYFGYDENQRDDLNFRQNLKSIKKIINLWKWRGLSLLGRIQIVKTFVIPKLMFRASVTSIPNELIKEANSICYNFIWNGKDKVKRNALVSDIEKGGLNMLDIDSMIRTKRVMCLKKFLEDYPSPWKTILKQRLLPVGGSFVLYCNFDTSKLSVKLPFYYKQCFEAWSELNVREPSSFQQIVNEIIWNNRFCCIEKKSIYRRDIANMGFLKVGDLFSASSFTLKSMHSFLSPEQNFLIMRIVNSIPTKWRSVIRNSTMELEIEPIPKVPPIRIEDKSVPILDVSSKQIYQLFLKKKHTPPTAKQKLMTKYPNISIDWNKVYLLAFQTTLESKLREFQYKILNRIVFTNEKLFRLGIVESPKCDFCQDEAESIEHLLFSCTISSEFWKHVLSWLRDNNIYMGILTETDLIFGKFDVKEDVILINHILLLGKYYIYSRKCQHSKPSLRGFIARIERIFNIELYIARKRDKLPLHYKKWEKLNHIFVSDQIDN